MMHQALVHARVARRAALRFLLAFSLVFGQVVPGSGQSGAVPQMAREKLWLVISNGSGAPPREHAITAEVAATLEQSAVGLMFRTSLPDDEGMLFPSAAPREATMWMRNTFIPLDMVFIRADGVVHRIEAMTEPHSEAIIESRGPVLAVLELRGGRAAELGLKPGDRVRHPIFKSAK